MAQEHRLQVVLRHTRRPGGADERALLAGRQAEPQRDPRGGRRQRLAGPAEPLDVGAAGADLLLEPQGAARAHRRGPRGARSAELDHALDLERHATVELLHADGRPGVAAGVTHPVLAADDRRVGSAVVPTRPQVAASTFWRMRSESAKAPAEFRWSPSEPNQGLPALTAFQSTTAKPFQRAAAWRMRPLMAV